MFENDHNENGVENTQFENQLTNDDLSVSGVENVTKKSKGKKAALIGGISAAVVVGGSATAYAASDTVKNQVKLRLSSPEKYYAWVTENNSEDLGKMLSESYQKALDNYDKGQKVDFKLSFEPTQEAKDILIDEIFGSSKDDDEAKQFVDIINNNDDIGIAASFSNNKGNSNSNFGVELGDNRLVSLEIASDMENMDYFGRIPELKEQWIGFETGKLMDELAEEAGDSSLVDTYKDIIKDPASFLSPEEMETEITRYAGVWSSFADDVELEKKESVDICDITVNYTVASVELNEKDINKLALEYLKELKDDKIIRDIVVEKTKAIDDKDEYEEAIDDAIDYIKENLEDDDFDKDTVVTIDTYIDATGTIRGIGISADEGEFTAIIGKDGDNVRGEVKFVEDDEEQFLIELTADEEGKDKYSGDVTISYPKTSYDYDDDDGKLHLNTEIQKAVIKFDEFEVVDKEKGYFNGDFTLNIPDVDPISFSCSSDGSKQVFGYDLHIDGTDYGKIKFTYSIEYGVKADVPDKGDAYMINVDDLDDFSLEDYVSEDDLNKFAKDVMVRAGIKEDTASDYAKEIAEEVMDEIDGGYSYGSDDDYDFDDDDFDWDDDDDDDDDDDYYSSASDFYSFDWDSLKYDDYKDFMTEEEFKEYIEEMKEYSKEWAKEEATTEAATTKKAS